MKAPPKADMADSCTRILINGLASQGLRLSVKLDGKELEKVVAYDCQQGWAQIYQLDSNGMVMIDYLRKEGMTERVKGTITAEVVKR